MRQVRGTVNRIELIGWLGDAPEQRVFATGSKVCKFRVATKRMAGRNDQGEVQIETDWTPVEVWEKLAEQCQSSLHKGSRVRVSGALLTRSWSDNNSGQRHYRTFVRADEVMFLDARPDQPESQELDGVATDEEDGELPF